MICKVQLGNELGTYEDSTTGSKRGSAGGLGGAAKQVGITALPVGAQLLIQLHPYLALAPLNYNQSFLILDNVG